MKKTIKMYKENIETLESQLNERINSVDFDVLPKSFKNELQNIQRLRPKSRSVKADYKRYERELEYALQWDIATEEGRRQLDKKEQKAFDTFKNRFDLDVTYQEWRDLVETFGAIGSATMEQFYRGGANGRGSGDLVRVYKDAKEIGKDPADMLKAIRKVKRASKTDAFKMKYGATTQGLIDALRDELELNKERNNLQERRTQNRYNKVMDAEEARQAQVRKIQERNTRRKTAKTYTEQEMMNAVSNMSLSKNSKGKPVVRKNK